MSQENELFVLIYFEVDRTYMVIEKSKLKDYDEENQTALVYFPISKKHYSGTIKKEGSRKKCEKRCNKYLESQKTDVSSTEDEIRNFENKAESLKSKSTTDLFTKEMEKLNKLSLKRPCDSDLFTDEESEKAANCAKCDDKFNKLNEELIEIKSNLLDLKNILCEFVQNNNRTLNDSGKKEVIYNGKNLVDISASNTTKYVTQIMDLMFTKEELANGYIIEGNSRSKRDALDIGKIELLRDAFFTKYNIPGSNQDETYKWIKSRAKRKCQDTKMNN